MRQEATLRKPDVINLRSDYFDAGGAFSLIEPDVMHDPSTSLGRVRLKGLSFTTISERNA